MIEFGVLGPLLVSHHGSPVVVGAPMLRRLLAALLCRPGRPLSIADLVGELWDSGARPAAARTLQVYIHRLRRAIGEGGQWVRCEPGGYRIVVTPDELDALRFAELAGRGQAAHRRGELDRASRLWDDALGLWRGSPFAGVTTSRLIEDEIHRLEELRLLIQQDRITVDLDLGRHVRLVPELTCLAAAHPYREQLRGLLMLALYRSGRQTEALEVFRATRALLADELGVEPHHSLHRLHEAMLRTDRRLTRLAAGSLAGEWEPVADRPVTLAAREVPRQLPGNIAGFAGRTAQLAALDALLAITGTGTEPATVVTAITGSAGVGKTALAVHWAHRMAAHFPDGQLYADLRGFTAGQPPMPPTDVIRGFLESLDGAAQQIPAELPARAARYRSLLAGRRMLIVLDNAADTEQVRPLLPGATGSLVVVTSRNPLAGLVVTGAHPLVLDTLTAPEAHELLAHRLGSARLADEPAAVKDLIAACARLPLALAIAAARAATLRHLPLRELVRELHAAHPGLDGWSNPDPSADLRTAFDVSYRTLSADAARLFRLLALHPGPEISVAAAASLLPVPADRARRLLAELTTAHLLTERDSGRYGCHDLLRAYAHELTGRLDLADTRRAATRRMLDFYLHTAAAAAQLMHQHRTPVALPPRDPAVVPEPVAKPAALAWLTQEYQVLRAAIRLAAAAGFDSHAWQLAWTVSDLLHLRGDWHEWRDTQRTALAAAGRLADLRGQAISHRLIAGADYYLRSFDDAHRHLLRALELQREIGDRWGQARVHIDLGGILGEQGRHRAGLAHIEQAVPLCQEVGDLAGHAFALNGVGWLRAQLGEYEQALPYCQRAVALQQEIDDRLGQPTTWDSLGYIHHHLGRHQQAVTCYRRGLELARQVRNRHVEARVLHHLGDAHLTLGEPGASGRAWREALAILEELGDAAEADQVRAKLPAGPLLLPRHSGDTAAGDGRDGASAAGTGCDGASAAGDGRDGAPAGSRPEARAATGARRPEAVRLTG